VAVAVISEVQVVVQADIEILLIVKRLEAEVLLKLLYQFKLEQFAQLQLVEVELVQVALLYQVLMGTTVQYQVQE
jgi:hypothetical protein